MNTYAKPLINSTGCSKYFRQVFFTSDRVMSFSINSVSRGWRFSSSNMHSRNMKGGAGDERHFVGEINTAVLEKAKVDVQCLNRKLEDMRRELVEMRVGTSLACRSVMVEQELELGREIEKTRDEVEGNSSC